MYFCGNSSGPGGSYNNYFSLRPVRIPLVTLVVSGGGVSVLSGGGPAGL